MKYLSVCSGIEAATVAWEPLGWKPWAFAEIEKFPAAVLKTHYPDVPNLGDMTKFKDWPDADIDVLVGGTPCQSYSVAGLRQGLDDPRGDLMLTYVAIARRYRPSWVVWENVPGVLSDDEGRSFGTLLGLLTGQRIEVPSEGWQSAGFVEGYKSAYGVAWRVLDTQFVRVDGFARAVPQRRRRVFVVGYLGDWRRAAAVLFERESMSGDTAPRREAGKGIAPTISSRPTGGGGLGTDFDCDGGLIADAVSRCDTAQNQRDEVRQIDAAGALAAEPGMKQQTYIAFSAKDSGGDASSDLSPTLRAGGHSESHANAGVMPAVAFQPRFARNGRGAPDTVASALTGEAGRTGKGDSAQCVAFGIRSDASRDGEAKTPSADAQGRVRLRNPGMGVYEGVAPTVDASAAHSVATAWAVRRLTPTECERLQAMRDGYTNIPWRGKNGAPDGPRYKVLGNSMSVNVMRWLGWRIQMITNLCKSSQSAS